MNKGVAIIEESDVITIDAVKQLFANADAYVDEFLNRFAQTLNDPISAVLPRNRPVTATPLEIYTHAFAHEFHHKGQIMTMCRLLGHTPPDTDIIRF
ncbi:hypothetical protein GCM10023149_12130 [Mucilaginibacter gynuensis]|uniref:DinB family protein n=2 Tax=Mucilaginibacter gynuensis TaxID=1302236 RepID=A0ABP8G1R2_9SPHI